jgi:hypothetical protein
MDESFEWIEPFHIIEAKNLKALLFEDYYINIKDTWDKIIPQ